MWNWSFSFSPQMPRTAPLHSKVSHICAYLGHAYEIRWDQPLETLVDLLDIIPRLHRSMGVALDLCTQLSDTLKGSPPVVPPYLSANKSLSELVRFMDGVPSGKMVGKQAAPATLQAQCDTMTRSVVAPQAAHLVWTPWLVALHGSHRAELDVHHNDALLHPRGNAGPSQHSAPSTSCCQQQ